MVIFFIFFVVVAAARVSSPFKTQHSIGNVKTRLK